MASTYPGTLDTFATTSPTNLGDDDAQARNHAERHDDIGDAVNKIEAELGVDPAGSFSTVKARLDAPATLWHLPMVAGTYFAPGQFTQAPAISAEAQMIGMVMVPMRNCTIDSIGVAVTVVGTTGAVVRLGMYAWNHATALPGSLLVDGGTVGAETTGAKEVTVSQAVVAGQPYLLACAVQGAAGTRPTLVSCGGRMAPYGESTPSYVGSQPAIYVGSITGAFPSDPTWAFGNFVSPRIWVRTSA